MMERRKSLRFVFQQPVEVRIRNEDGWEELRGLTENASARGVLFTSDAAMYEGADVEITILMPHDLRMSCSGKVVRIKDSNNTGNIPPISVAVHCSSPFTTSKYVAPLSPGSTFRLVDNRQI